MSGANLITEITKPIAKGETAKWSYTSLIFSLFYLFPIAFNYDNYTTENLFLVVVIYLVFIGLFLQVMRSSGNRTKLPIVAIILLSALGAGVHPGTNVLFGYAAYFSGYYFKPRIAVTFLLFNILSQLVSAHLFELMTIYFFGPSIAISVSLHLYGVLSRKDTIAQLNQSQQSEQIEHLAAIAERERIARDMHDLLGHSLSSLALKSELAQKLMTKGELEKAACEISEVAALSRETLSEVREAVTGLKKKSLAAGISDLIKQLEHLNFSTNCSLSLPKLSAKIESGLLMLCKEWVTNILRHSKGDKVNIQFSHTDSNIVIVITDNGSVLEIVPGNGILGMQSRVDELNGQLEIKVKEGVELFLSLPIDVDME